MDPYDPQDRLERLVGRVLREQPLRRAPRTLEARVFAAIEQRAALPWWRKGFTYWPLAARVAFLLVSFGFVKLALTGVTWVVSGVDSAPVVTEIAQETAWMQAVIQALLTAAHSIPSGWIWGGIAVLGAMYAVLFGLGAAAYRALYAGR